jgi:protein involved in polysaccharide export with SLBB domain
MLHSRVFTDLPRGILKCIFLLALLAGCVSSYGTPSAGRARTARVPAADTMAYVLRSGDDIEVKFRFAPELNERQVIRPNGNISLPAVGDVQAAGNTVESLEATLREKYANELEHPELLVVVRAYGSNTVFVGGEVGTPGQQAMVWPTTALQIILQAGGFKDTARANEVLLIRLAASSAPKWQVLDLEKTLNAEDFADNVLLAPHDIIYVPRSPIANVGEFVELYIRRLLPVQPYIQIPIP